MQKQKISEINPFVLKSNYLTNEIIYEIYPKEMWRSRFRVEELGELNEIYPKEMWRSRFRVEEFGELRRREEKKKILIFCGSISRLEMNRIYEEIKKFIEKKASPEKYLETIEKDSSNISTLKDYVRDYVRGLLPISSPVHLQNLSYRGVLYRINLNELEDFITDITKIRKESWKWILLLISDKITTPKDPEEKNDKTLILEILEEIEKNKENRKNARKNLNIFIKTGEDFFNFLENLKNSIENYEDKEEDVYPGGIFLKNLKQFRKKVIEKAIREKAIKEVEIELEAFSIYLTHTYNLFNVFVRLAKVEEGPFPIL
ncbi:MAG: hypothetical protein ACPLXS_01240 [Candidatus Micrarchaeales archaeon]